MTNERRKAIYLRDRKELTPAQRRRIKAKTPYYERKVVK